MDIHKLAKFLEVSSEDVRSILVHFKLKNRQIKWVEGDILEGESANISEIDVGLENDIIHVSETKNSRKYADWFIRNTTKNYSAQDFIAHPEKYDENQNTGKKNQGKRHDKKDAKKESK